MVITQRHSGIQGSAAVIFFEKNHNQRWRFGLAMRALGCWFGSCWRICWLLSHVALQLANSQESQILFDPAWQQLRREEIAKLEKKSRKPADCPAGYVHTFFIRSIEPCAPCPAGSYAARMRIIASTERQESKFSSCQQCPAGANHLRRSLLT